MAREIQFGSRTKRSPNTITCKPCFNFKKTNTLTRSSGLCTNFKMTALINSS